MAKKLRRELYSIITKEAYSAYRRATPFLKRFRPLEGAIDYEQRVWEWCMSNGLCSHLEIVVVDEYWDSDVPGTPTVQRLQREWRSAKEGEKYRFRPYGWSPIRGQFYEGHPSDYWEEEDD